MTRHPVLLSALLLTGLIAGPAPAELRLMTQPAPDAASTQPAATQPKVDPQARAVLQAAARQLAQLDRFRVRLVTDTRMEGPGMKHQMTAIQTLAVDRPDRLALRQQGMMGSTLVVDGQQMYTYVPMFGKYTMKPAPASLAALDLTENPFPGQAPLLPVLLAEDPLALVLTGVSRASYVGKQDLDGEPHHHLRLVIGAREIGPMAEGGAAFDGMTIPIDVWIRQEPAVLTRVVPDTTVMRRTVGEAMDKQMPDGFQDMQMTYDLRFEGWELDPAFDEATFAFTPPADAQKVDDLFEPVPEPPADGEQAEPEPAE